MRTPKTSKRLARSWIRPGRILVWGITAALLLWWWYLVLGPNLPILLAGLTAIAGAVWTVRRRPEIALCAAIAVGTAAVYAAGCVIVVDRQIPGAADVVAVLTGYLLATPIPAFTACLLRPALVSAPLSALIGSAILLLSAAPVLLAGPHGLSAAVLVTALILAVGVIWLRHRRAAAQLTDTLPVVAGWTDLGGRRTPDGARIDRLLIGHGHAAACTAIDGHRITDRAALAVARRAAAVADALGLPTERVQPVILTAGSDGTVIRRHLVNDGEVAASVVIAPATQLRQVTAQVPTCRLRGRRALLAAALLPALPERTPHE